MRADRFRYYVDLVLCLDGRASMLNSVRDGGRLVRDLNKAMADRNRIVDRFRMRVILFDGFVNDHVASRFFEIPEESHMYTSFLDTQATQRDIDPIRLSPVSALDEALKSLWTTQGTKPTRVRHIVLVWAAEAVQCAAGYLEQLTDMWEGPNALVDKSGKRLVMYTPDVYPWCHIATNWENTAHYASAAGDGLPEVAYNAIVDAIVNSV